MRWPISPPPCGLIGRAAAVIGSVLDAGAFNLAARAGERYSLPMRHPGNSDPVWWVGSGEAAY